MSAVSREELPPFTRLQEILDSEGRRYSWLAREIGVDSATMTRYVQGMRVPTHRREAIAQALQRTVADVFPGSAS